MSSEIGMLYPIPPYNFESTVAAARYSRVLGVARDGVFRRALRVGDAIVLVEVSSRGAVDAPALAVRQVAASAPVDARTVLDAAARILNVRGDLRPFYALARGDEALWRVVEPLHGLHMLQTETLFEALMLTIVEQQISLAAAQRAHRWLLAWAGESISAGDETYFVFPRAEGLASATVEQLTPLKITFRRMQAMIDLARRERERPLERLRALPSDEAYAELIGLKGVGHWTAAWTMTRGLGHYIYIGSADVALRAAVNHYFYGETGRCPANVTDATFARYGEYAGLAGFYTISRWAFERY